ncbi:MAG: diguanylate cyclase, partial [Methylotenera sp.]
MQKKISTIWRFLLPVLVLLAVAPFVLTGQQASQQLDNIHAGASEQAHTLVRLLDVTEELVSEQANSAMRLLKQRSQELGKVHIDGLVQFQAMTLPNLKMGETEVAGHFNLVDGVSDLFGGTATMFVRSGDGFVRIATNVKQDNGARAVGTVLNPKGKVIGALLAGKEYHGVVDILGQPYITRYDPVFDENGQVIGAYYIGYKVDIKILRDTVENMRQLTTGFA